ncbi:hypothetical protein PHLCEN_2v11887 [Hermanssonia centrifuga]|uniref:guanosine-diphosphatase n=1 Tax=Hermanssonia centrifuga TaxID=98765 RepID=A0A2R6NIT2_9APHY|nr:hypothetical protein PHLCEN_2v11887 [Hermanssonia centrifuga]
MLPSSPDTDPDPAKTIVCTTPFKPSLPLVQYAVIIDAGITGSRMHIYKLNNCLPTILYEYKVFRTTRASLHRYQDRPLEAAQSLDVLLDEVLDIVPTALHKWTPVIIKASYSHRLFLDWKKWAEILDAIRHRLDERYPFSLRDAGIMSEKEQGIYSWIAANYLMDALHADSPPNTPTYAVLGLAGAITNIIFEPELDLTKPDNVLQESKDKYELNFGGRIRVLYQHTHVGFGLNSARTKIHHLVESMASVEGQMAHEGTIANPCLAKGTTQVVETLWERKSKKINMMGDDVGSFEACNRIVELVLAKDPICEVRPCWFDDVDQPSLLDTFPNGKVVLYYYFYDRIRPLIAESSAKPPRAIKISVIATLAEQLCQGKSSWDKWWGHDDALMVELERNPQWCLDLTFIYALLRHGYGLESDKEVQIGAELDWTLGVAIAMLQS